MSGKPLPIPFWSVNGSFNKNVQKRVIKYKSISNGVLGFSRFCPRAQILKNTFEQFVKSIQDIESLKTNEF